MSSPIKDFYKEKSILITGATGFLGKVLCEKLVRSCPDIANIYVVLRSRHEKSAEQRLEEELINSKAFSFNSKQKIKFEKLIAINGDLTKPGLGLSDEDRQTLINNVSVVFHSAASVRFCGPITDFLDQNVFGTESVMKLCSEMTKLEALVYVSTAYSNCNNLEVKESVYKLHQSATETIRSISEVDPFGIKTLSETTTALEGRPNSYTYSKAIAENLVTEKYSHLPVVIVRPSIVTSALKEPTPGWVDNVNGVAGGLLLGTLGIARTIDLRYHAKADIIPVDIICNSLIAIGWYSATNKNQRKQVIHLTSGQHNPITWGQLLEYIRVGAVEYPSVRVVRPLAKAPGIKKGAIGRMNYLVTKYVSEFLFAYFVDIFLSLLGYKRFMVKIIGKLHRAFSFLEPFTTKEWHFHNENYYEIHEQMSEEDQNTFYSDVRKVDWVTYSKSLYMGIRRYLLKESDETVEKARQRSFYINMIFSIIQVALVIFMVPLIYYLFISKIMVVA